MSKLTREQVHAICGPLDDAIAAKFIGTGATAAELMEAKTWLTSDDYLGPTLERSAHGRVAQLIDLMRENDLEFEEP